MPIIEVKNIGKKYNISHRQGGYLTLRDVLTNIFSNPFRFLKQKAKAVTGLAKTEEFWALKDISFNVEKGEVIGIIGHNGAGKSTLLKILSQITPPTTGEIKINGRVGSLLEVGTGFHPELTGRENIFLNGAILGMERAQIVKKFDEIVEFSGVEKFLDTPVKYYSSGMYVRLAFSVAAHMEPDVLIIDEVLAVGDADFQKKCLGKMDEITKAEGRTILFVSHNMSAIKQLCKRGVLLEGGRIKTIGNIDNVIEEYANSSVKNDFTLGNDKIIGVVKFDFINKLNEPSRSLRFEIDVNAKASSKVYIAIGINDIFGNRISTAFSKFNDVIFNLEIGINRFSCDVNSLILKPGNYYVSLFVGNDYEVFDFKENLVEFKISEYSFYKSGIMPDSSQGSVLINQTWNSIKI